MKGKSLYLLLGFSLLVFGVVIYFRQNKSVIVLPSPSIFPSPSNPSFLSAKVTKVYDGDTIEIEGGQKVRYIGIDSPEVYPTAGCFSKEAKTENEKLVLGKEVKLVKDVSETDKYGRLLRYVYVDNDFVNDDLVKNGFVKIMTISPDTKYSNEFLESQKYAKENNLGLWFKCGK